MSALKRLAVGEDDRFRVLAALDRGDADAEPEARAEGGVLFQEKIRHDRRDRPAHRARDLDHRRLGPEARGGRGDLEPDESGADDDDLGLRAEALADRGRVGDVAEREDARQIDARRIEPPLPRASREDEMSVTDRAAVAELDLLRSAVDPRRADAEPQVDALLAEMRVGPEREPMDVHLALEKRLGQRRALIGQILLGGEKNDLAVESLFAQGRRGLNPGMAGADDDDRGQGRGFEIAGAVDPAEVSFIGVEPEAAPFGFVLLGARVVGRHRRGIDDDARSGRGNDGWRLRGLRARLRRDRLGRWRDRAGEQARRSPRRGGGAAGPRLSTGAARRSSGVRQTKPSSVPDGETGAQRSLMTPSATQALSRGARAARPSHSRTAP